MIKPDIVNETPISMTELKGILKKNHKKDEELNFRAGKAWEYLEQFSRLKDKEYADLYKKLEELKVARLKEIHFIKIIDVLPTTPEEVKSVLMGYPISLTQVDLKKVADVVAAFV